MPLQRAVIALEDIGWGGTGEKFNRLRPGQSPKAWVARLLKFDPDHGIFGDFERQFVPGQRDFSRTNRTGSRGIYLYFALVPGVYEVNERTSWSNSRRYFVRVNDDTSVTEISREEAIAWLEAQAQPSADSASAS